MCKNDNPVMKQEGEKKYKTNVEMGKRSSGKEEKGREASGNTSERLGPERKN